MSFPITAAPDAAYPFTMEEEAGLGFGRYFAPHMFLMNYDETRGWRHPRIQPYGPLALEPGALVLHYGQMAYEGMKAYRGLGDRIYLFRPRENMRRLANSCERLCIPPFPADVAMEAIRTLVSLDRDWVPRSPGGALYIRPDIIATEPALGVRAATEYLMFIITSPVGAYFAAGFNPIRIMIEPRYVRAVRGGLGEAKTSANYAASLKAQKEAQKRGYDQVLWLDGVERRYVEEVGSMNIFFLFGGELVTPALNGSILPGITRDAVITLGRDLGYPVAERPVSIESVIEGLRSGSLTEIFGTGTAAIVAPVARLLYEDAEFTVGDGKAGPVSERLFALLSGLQTGVEPDTHGWRETVL